MATRLSGFLWGVRDTLRSKVPHESLVYVLGNEAAGEEEPCFL